MTRRVAAAAARVTGVTVISTRDRDKILDSAPWVAPYFPLPEKPRRFVPSKAAAPGDDGHLRRDNPRLADLSRRYAGQAAAEAVRWIASDVEAQIDLSSFRGDNLYVFQSRRYSPSAFYATAAYVKEVDRLRLWTTLAEDDFFGVETFDFHGKTVSRDLLDSILEINFLDRHLRIFEGQPIRVLDVGAGYGRLAHRMASATSKIAKYYCADAVPESTFLSEFYLKFRGMDERCSVIPLDHLGELKDASIDLAVNVHCFPECTSTAIAWWLLRLREMQVPWFFVEVSSDLGLTSHERRGARASFLPIIEGAGYEIAVREQKFREAPVLQRYGLYPSDYYLFRRR